MNWFQGKLDDHVLILGIHILWIARIAKLLEFVSGSVIVLDWIGAKTLKHWDEAVTVRFGKFRDWVGKNLQSHFGLSLFRTKVQDFPRPRRYLSHFFIWPLEAIVLAFALFVLLPMFCVGFVLDKTAHVFVRNEEDPARPFVGFAFIILLIAFALDFIAS